MCLQKKDDRTIGETNGKMKETDRHCIQTTINIRRKKEMKQIKCSVFQPAPGDTGKPCGVDYELKTIVAGSDGDISKPKKQSVSSTFIPISD